MGRTFKILLAVCLFLSVNVHSQIAKWILGNSQQLSGGGFYTMGSNNLAFFEADFSGPTPVVSARTLGASINSIVSMGTMDVINNAVTPSGDVQFYLFAAARSAYNNFSGVVADTVYFAAFNSATGADEVFGKVAADDRISSVIEHALCPRPGYPGQYYFIYKTHYASNTYDDVKYVIVDGNTKTVGTPVTLIGYQKTGEGFTVSQYDCSANRYWLYTTRLEAGGNITIRKSEISSTGIGGTVDEYTIYLTGNAGAAVITALEISSDGSMLAACLFSYSSNKAVSIFDLDNLTGSLSNERWYKNLNNYPIVTCEFSPDGTRLYLMQGGGSLFPNQVFNCPVIPSGSYNFGSMELMTSVVLNGSLAMEKAFNGKIYINKGHNLSSLHVIDNPNSATPTVSSTSSPFFGTSTFRIGDAFPDQIDGPPTSTGLSVAISPPVAGICTGQSVTLTGTGATTFQWSGGSSSTSSSITVSPASTTTYYLEGVAGACVGYDTITVTVNPTPTASISGPDSICSGEDLTLIASGAPSYQWTAGSSATTASISPDPAVTTVYTVVPSAGGCTGSPVSHTVFVTQSPSAQIIGDDTLCSGETVTLNAITSSGSVMQWSGSASGSTNPLSFPATNSGTYYLTASNNGCVARDTFQLQVFSESQAEFVSSYSSCTGSQNFTSIPSVQGLWIFGDGTTATALNPQHVYPDGIYNVTFIVNPGSICADTASQSIIVVNSSNSPLSIPNVFTPNGDGQNDSFLIGGLNGCTTYDLTIYNRWGQIVFSTTDPHLVAWTGENGQKQQQIAGTYFYLLKPDSADDSAKAIHGSISLIR